MIQSSMILTFVVSAAPGAGERTTGNDHKSSTASGPNSLRAWVQVRVIARLPLSLRLTCSARLRPPVGLGTSACQISCHLTPLARFGAPNENTGDRPMLKLPGHPRYDYSPIVKRPDYSWPGGKRLAFYVALNIEHFAFGTGIGMDPSNRTGQQTTRNFAWR